MCTRLVDIIIVYTRRALQQEARKRCASPGSTANALLAARTLVGRSQLAGTRLHNPLPGYAAEASALCRRRFSAGRSAAVTAPASSRRALGVGIHAAPPARRVHAVGQAADHAHLALRLPVVLGLRLDGKPAPDWGGLHPLRAQDGLKIA